MRWIAALIGYFLFRFPGAVIGFLVGSFYELLQHNNQRFGPGPNKHLNPEIFELNLLSLASLVIKADGAVSKKELDFVRKYFISTYGEAHAQNIFRIFNEKIKDQKLSPVSLCDFFVQHTQYASRLQLLHFLFGIAQADGQVSEVELDKIYSFSRRLRIGSADFQSIKAMFVSHTNNAYTILEINENASESEIKKAYRDMAKKHHPDKLQHLGEAYVKAAQEKFQRIQDAYEQIKKSRGF